MSSSPLKTLDAHKIAGVSFTCHTGFTDYNSDENIQYSKNTIKQYVMYVSIKNTSCANVLSVIAMPYYLSL